MSLFETMQKDLEKYKPKLVLVELKGNFRSGEDEYGNEIISMDVDDKKQLPVSDKRLKPRTKRIIFVTEKVAKHYMEHEDCVVADNLFPVPSVQPDDLNQYWIRRIYPVMNKEEEKEE